MALPRFFGLLRGSWDSLGVRDDPRARPERPQKPLQRPQEPRQCHSTDYALLPEYLFVGSAAVGGIHCYIVDADGRLAFVVLQNSHWPEFTEVDPKTTDDCSTVLITVLRDELGESEVEE